MPEFSNEQKQIINEQNRNLIVSASAGSGKTTVMIERLVKLIEDGKTTLSKILVLTFTNNSANDMKEKLYKKLSESQNANCKAALFDIANANISNIHQFCKRLIQKYFYVCDVDPAFSVISENEALVLKDRALDKTIESFFYNNNEKLDAFLENNFEKRNFDKIKEMILTLFTFLSILEKPDEWLKENATKNYERKVSENAGIKILCENARFVLNHYYEEFNQLIKHIDRFFNVKNFESLLCLQKNIQTLTSCLDSEKLVNQIVSFTPECRDGSKDKIVKEFFKENIKPVFDEFKKDFKKVQESFGADSVKRLEEFLKSNKASGDFLCELAKAFINEYSKIKKEKFLLDFDDLEFKAKQLLDEDNIRNEIRENFDYCFIDEYQDINILQEAIISSVANKSFYFGVGDAKQAIYGFRLCSPEIFISKFSSYKQEQNKNLAASLNKNFRSKINILRFVNKVFDVIMTEGTSQIDYKKEARFQSDNLDETSKVKINIILSDNEKIKEETKVYKLSKHEFDLDDELTNSKLEAEIAYQEILKLRQNGANFSDIAILSRNRDTNDFVREFFKELKDRGVPVISAFRTNLLEFKEISFVHNLIKLVNNFKDDVVLFKVLTFPFFNFSVDELIQIRNSSNKNNFTECFIEKEKDNIKIQNFFSIFNKIKLISQNLSVVEFAEYLIQMLTDSATDEIRDENSIQHFESYLNFIKQINPESLTDYARLTENENLETTISDSTNDNAVLFCTIHSSKGLEYKHVILIGSGKKLNLNNNDDVLIDEKVGIGTKGFDEDDEKKKTPIYNAIKLISRKKNFSEEIRLLYVALTRAKESLTVIGSMSKKAFEKIKSFKNDFEILKSENYLELILKSFSNGEISKLKADGSVKLMYEKNEVAECEVVISNEIKFQKKIERNSNSFAFSKTAVDNWEKLTNVKNVYLKNSVSAILKAELNEIDYSNKMFEADEKSSSEIGTAYHEFLSKLSFSKDDESILIPKQLDKKFIDMFYNSEIYNYCKNKKIKKEVPFLFYDILPEKFGFGKEKILLQGVIDLLVEYDDSFIVVDYKASSANDETLKARYQTQLELYSYCAEKILNKKCKKKLIYKIFNGKTVEIE